MQTRRTRALSVLLVLLDAPLRLGRGDVAAEALHVEPEAGGVALDVLVLELALVLEEEIVHLPELSLVARGDRRASRRERVRVRAGERVVLEDEPHAPLELAQQLLEQRMGAAAVGALEVAELDDGDLRHR